MQGIPRKGGPFRGPVLTALNNLMHSANQPNNS